MRDIEDVAREIVDAAFKVHTTLGPGLLESVYELALFHELTKRGFKVERQVPVIVEYDGVALGTGFKIDLLAEDMIIVELKSVDKMNPVFKFQTPHAPAAGKEAHRLPHQLQRQTHQGWYPTIHL